MFYRFKIFAENLLTNLYGPSWPPTNKNLATALFIIIEYEYNSLGEGKAVINNYCLSEKHEFSSGLVVKTLVARQRSLVQIPPRAKVNFFKFFKFYLFSKFKKKF